MFIVLYFMALLPIQYLYTVTSGNIGLLGFALQKDTPSNWSLMVQGIPPKIFLISPEGNGQVHCTCVDTFAN